MPKAYSLDLRERLPPCISAALFLKSEWKARAAGQKRKRIPAVVARLLRAR